MRGKFVGALLVALLLTMSACSGPASGTAGLHIVVTTTILGDVVTSVTGGAAVVDILLPIGADPHEFQASSRQITELGRADLVVANGLGLEEGLDDVLSSLEADGTRVFRVGDQLDPIPFGLDAGKPNDLDPHVWMDPGRMATAARLISAELQILDPDGPWLANADVYVAELESLDVEIEQQLASVANRVLVTNHDSLAYFADRYGFEVVGVVIPGGSTLAAPSSAELAELVSTVESLGVSVIFTESTESEALGAAVAAEADTAVAVVRLFIGSLGGPGSGAETYIDMMRTDAALIAGALD
jgi:zinc/manganese transport system substrate-binding protein